VVRGGAVAVKLPELKILTMDIETAPLESYTWGIWEQNVGLDMIATEWSILSYSAKYLGRPAVAYADTGGRGKSKVRDDKAILKQIWGFLNEADIVIGQNVRRFDLKKINARLIVSGFRPYSPVRVIDTMEAAKRSFAFTSNKLEWLSKYLTNSPKSKHKKFPGFELWKECLEDNPSAWAEMKKYNKQDVIATEKLYMKLRPWITNHPNLAVYTDTGMACPKCGSLDIEKNGTRATSAGRYQRYRCNDCGGCMSGKKLLAPLAARKDMLVSL
jgi:predicted RNA-binding Zn-ribbon protein involved in translation (DUF1610 family)